MEEVQSITILSNRLQSPVLLDRIGVLAVSLVQKNMETGSWIQNAPLTQAVKRGTKPLRDYGDLFNSPAYRIEGNKVLIGINRPYAELIHNGGTIRPKTAKSLAIPASAETRKFMRMYGATPRDCIAGMQNAGYTVYRPKGKNVILAQKGKKGKTHMLFILRKSVTIPARPFLRLPEAYRKFMVSTIQGWLIA